MNGDLDEVDRGGGRRPGGAWWPALWFGAVVAIGLLMFSYRSLHALLERGPASGVQVLAGELTAAFGAGVLFFAVQGLVRRFPLDRGRARRHLALYLPAVAAFSVAHTTSNVLLRTAIYAAGGLGVYDHGPMSMRFLMELPIDVIIFTLMAGALHVWRHTERMRLRELGAERLEKSLVEANLRNLQLQLHPHFLFNALNTVSSTMYRDVERADDMIEKLAGLLRTALRTSRSDRVPLAEEIAVLEDYLSIMRARFEERLVVDMDVDAAASRALVPPLLLQPLVENAIRHGGIDTRGTVRIALRAARRGDSLWLSVEDDGPGLAPGVDPFETGLGLSATAERLRLLYGGHQHVEAGNGAAGGFRVSLQIPFAAAESSAA
jgi:two-component system, LytTR family, sensor kinase